MKTYKLSKLKMEYLLLILLVSIMVFPRGLISGYVPYVIIGFTFLAAIGANYGRLNISYSLIVYTVCTFWGSVLWGVIFGDYSILSAIRSSLAIYMPFFALQIGKRISNIEKKVFLNAILFLLLLEAVIGLVQVNRGVLSDFFYMLYKANAASYYNTVSWFRGFGTFGNPNAYGMGVCVLTALFINLNPCKRKQLMAIILMMISVIASKSRTSIIVAAVTLFIYFFYGQSIIKKIRNLFVFSFFFVLVYQIYGSVVNRSINLDGMTARFSMWSDYLSRLGEYEEPRRTMAFIFGSGVAYTKHYGAVDNEYLFLFLSTGIVGLLLFAGLFALFMYLVISCCELSVRKAGISIMTIWLICGITSEFMFSYMISIWVFVFLGMISQNAFIIPVAENKKSGRPGIHIKCC